MNHLRFLRYIDEIARCGSIRQAAERLHIAPSAVNRRLQDIEEELGTPIFERLPRGMRPNELGLFTLRYAQTALAGQRQFVDEFNALQQGGHGHLAIGAISGSAAHLLVAAVAEITPTFGPAVPHVNTFILWMIT